MYESFYGLRERPFDLTPNPRFLFLTPGHREALSNLHYGITGRKGMTVLVGEAGTGKTTIIRAALAAVGGPSVRCVYMNNPVLTRDEFYEFLAPKFGLSERAATSKARFLAELEDSVLERHEAGGLTALVLDEAQSLPHELLEEVRLLANFETATDKLLPVVLAGQPELAVRLEQEELRQLKQRVALRCDLMPLDLGETAAYIAGRIVIAGGDSPRIFSREAVHLIYERSRGIPRTISVICDNTLLSGFAQGVKPVGSHIVLEVCRDFRLPPRKVAALGSPSTADAAKPAGRPAASRTLPAPPADQVLGSEAPAPLTPTPASSAPTPDAKPARETRSESPHRMRDRGLFNHYTKKKRFGFF
ncbi:MAG TPA: AAA family ATPase [Vicinamibacterales bacterium]|jgi:general secretion pathway protein A